MVTAIILGVGVIVVFRFKKFRDTMRNGSHRSGDKVDERIELVTIRNRTASLYAIDEEEYL